MNEFSLARGPSLQYISPHKRLASEPLKNPETQGGRLPAFGFAFFQGPDLDAVLLQLAC